MGDTFRARSAPERRADQCPGSNRRRWIKKLNLSPNIYATPSHLLSSATDTASVVRPATNGSIAIKQKDRLDWQTDLVGHIHRRTKRLSLFGIARPLFHFALIALSLICRFAKSMSFSFQESVKSSFRLNPV